MAQVRLDVDEQVLDGLAEAAERLATEIANLRRSAVEVAAPVAEPAPAEPTGRPPLIWGARVSQLFRDRVWWIADTLSEAQGAPFDGSKLMACMAWETGEKFTASVKNMAGSGATGLIQFMPSTAKELGTSTAALARMTAEDQLNYVYKYFRQKIKERGPVTTLEDMYMAILWPAAVGKPATYPLFTKGIAYRQNAGLDSNKDGTVTKYEAAAHVRAKFDKGLKLAA
jgi:hypothetical protein